MVGSWRAFPILTVLWSLTAQPCHTAWLGDGKHPLGLPPCAGAEGICSGCQTRPRGFATCGACWVGSCFQLHGDLYDVLAVSLDKCTEIVWNGCVLETKSICMGVHVAEAFPYPSILKTASSFVIFCACAWVRVTDFLPLFYLLLAASQVCIHSHNSWWFGGKVSLLVFTPFESNVHYLK